MEHNSNPPNPEVGELNPAIKVRQLRPLSTIQPGEEYIEVYYHLPSVPHTKKDVIQFFQQKIGPISTFESRLLNNGNVCARIAFTNPTNARKAILVLDDTLLLGKKMIIALFIGYRRIHREQVPSWYIDNVDASPPLQASPSRSNKRSISVGNFPYGTTAAEIQKRFEMVGPIESVKLKLDVHGFYTGQAKLVFCDPSHACKALNFNNSFIRGRKIRVKMYERRLREKWEPAILPEKFADIPYEHLNCNDNDPVQQLSFIQPDHVPPNVTNREDEFIVVSNLPDFDLLTEEVVHFFNANIGLVRSFETKLVEASPDNEPTANVKIEFRKAMHASLALVALNNTMLFGRQIKINIFTDKSRISLKQGTMDQLSCKIDNVGPQGSNSDYVFLSDLPGISKAQTIAEHFTKWVGPVQSVGMELDDRGFYNGSAKLVFSDPSHARKAVSQDTHIFNDCPINIRVISDQAQKENEILSTDQLYAAHSPQQRPFMEPGEEFIIVSNLPSSMIGAEIIDFFQAQVGLVKSCGLFAAGPMNNGHLNFTGKARITFCKPEDARFALIALENSTLLGQPLEIQLFIDEYRAHRDQLIFYPPDSSNVHKYNVHISDLPLSVSATQIIEHFEQLVGPVESVGLELDERGIYNGNAKLVFHDPSNARKALMHHNSFFYGNRIKMTLYVNHQPVLAESEILPQQLNDNDLQETPNPAQPLVDTPILSDDNETNAESINNPQVTVPWAEMDPDDDYSDDDLTDATTEKHPEDFKP